MDQISARAEFLLPTSVPMGVIVSHVQEILRSFRNSVPSLAAAEAHGTAHDEFAIDLTLNSTSFAEMEQLVDSIAEAIGCALRKEMAARVERGATELVSV